MVEPWNQMIISVVCVIAITTCYANADTKKEEDNNGRAGKLLSLFQIVTFPNDGCVGGTKNGTCYTANECTNKKGVSAGTCAQGYGVCCTFSINCGSTSSQNCTYVESTTVSPGACKQTICPTSHNICQLRLDFNTFVIHGPSTNTLSETSVLNGAPAFKIADGVPSSFASRCLTDTFAVTNTGGTNPAPICGINSGQHMYVDVDMSGSNGCNDLVFQLGTTPIFTPAVTRQWSIKVTQYACDSPVRAPSGCTQYFFNSADVVKSYNFDGTQHLADQRQTICVRRAKNNCRICWTATSADDFAVSGFVKSAATGATAKSGDGNFKSSVCCGGGVMGKNLKGYDCVQIPGALKMTGAVSKAMLTASRFCGRNIGLATIAMSTLKMSTKAGANKTVCSTVIPFYIRFLSDGYEEAMAPAENKVPNRGFRLAYTQDSKQCV